MMPNTWTRAEHMLLVKMAQNGAAYESICNALSRHPRRVVWHKLKKAGFDAIAAQAPGYQQSSIRHKRDLEFARLHAEGLTPFKIGKQMNIAEGTVREALKRMGVYKPQRQFDNSHSEPAEVRVPGLPPGHLKPWPATAKFTSLDLPADPHRVGATYRPDPSYSSGVAEYGHV